MPSKKKKVACYLGEDEEQALIEFQARKDISGSEAVNLLIRDSLIEKASAITEYLTDDQVASYVGAREETVKEWRLGLRKPRGENILAALSKFDLHFGRWRVKDVLI